MRNIAMAAALPVIVSACLQNASNPDVKAIETAAHGTYVAAINSNDTETLMADLTDDIVYQAPHEPEVVGKDAVRKWAAAYFGAYRTEWAKTPIGFTVSGDWAFERYTYKSKDTDKNTGAISVDQGKGINVFRRNAAGQWRAAVDGWSSDIPVTATSDQTGAPPAAH